MKLKFVNLSFWIPSFDSRLCNFLCRFTVVLFQNRVIHFPRHPTFGQGLLEVKTAFPEMVMVMLGQILHKPTCGVVRMLSRNGWKGLSDDLRCRVLLHKQKPIKLQFSHFWPLLAHPSLEDVYMTSIDDFAIPSTLYSKFPPLS
jgi:hypothetical protein